MHYTTHKHQASNTTVHTFDSLSAAIEAAQGAASGTVKCRNAGNVEAAKELAERLKESVDNKQWADGLTWDECMSGITDPIESKRDAAARFDCGQFSAPVAPAPRRKRVKRLNEGTEIDAERFASEMTIEGIWSKRVTSRVHRPVVRVMLNAGARYDVTAAEMARNAAASLAFIRIAETSGYAVEVYWGSSFRVGCDSRHAIVVRVKEVHEAMDWGTLVGLTVGGSTQRSFGWQLRNVCLTVRHDNYGSSSREWHDTTEYDAVSMGWMTSDEEAQRWLKAACERLTARATGGELVAA